MGSASHLKRLRITTVHGITWCLMSAWNSRLGQRNIPSSWQPNCSAGFKLGAFVKIDVTKEGASVSSKESWLKAARKAHWCVFVCENRLYMAILYTQNLSKAPVLMIQPQFCLAKSLPPQPVTQIQYDPVGLPRNLAPKHCVDSWFMVDITN